MEIIQTSRDILNIIIAISILTLTGFFCWLLYYFIASVRNIFQITNDLKKNLDKLKELIEVIKQKIHTAFSFVSFLDESVEKVKSIIQKYKKVKKTPSKSKAPKTKKTKRSKTKTTSSKKKS